MYLRTRGEDAQEHGIRGELDRLKTTMLRVKEIEDKAKAMRVDRPAAHRMVSKSLWHAKEKPPRSQGELAVPEMVSYRSVGHS